MRRTLTVVSSTVGAVVLVALGVAVAGMASTSSSAGGVGETTSETTGESTTEKPTITPYRAALTAGAEVPKPKGVKPGAGGTFASKLTEKGGSYSLSWTLTYRKLTGKAQAAHLHRAKAGKAGPVLVSLCGPCRSGQSGKAKLSKTVLAALESGALYVNVHTGVNAAGEIRGQVKKAG